MISPIFQVLILGLLQFGVCYICYQRGRYTGQIEGQSKANYFNHRRAVMLVRRKANPFWINRRNN